MRHLIVILLLLLPQPVDIAGHRGMAGYTELSDASFQAAGQYADRMEIDVRMTTDGVPVLVHDETALRLHGVRSRYDEMTYAEVSRLRAADGTPVMTLRDYLRDYPGPVLIEIKQRHMTRAVLGLLRDYPHDAIIQSFSTKSLTDFRQADPDVRLMQIVGAGKEVPDVPRDWYLNIAYTDLGRIHTDHAFYVYTPNSERDIKAAVRAGASGIVTDRPDIWK